ncbi:lytic transglycosylase domain-containing protein [Candidatus Leptofilum sp.]|uniref:lytic transglycosylase domain-containing protein n=1 Tax=Candidatus Leptofilum sp. TaxID=3241576 RepID=UPI003B5CE008
MKQVRQRYGRFFVVGLLLTCLLLLLNPSETSAALRQGLHRSENSPEATLLSPMWSPIIRQWSTHIGVLANEHGLDPDFIAAVIKEESNGIVDGISSVGAVGLMGVMPQGPGLEWRPTTEELMIPAVNLRWGVAILAEVVRQAGGDLASALAAYSGGWEYAGSTVPRAYAASVLDNYARAVLIRQGLSPDIASQWTIAVELNRGYVPHNSFLILGEQPISGLYTYAPHRVFDYVDNFGHSYYINGYAVPVALVAPAYTDPGTAVSGWEDEIDIHLQARLSGDDVKIDTSNPRIILACLPSLSRLRGIASTRWFAPSGCPSWHR